MERKFNDKEKFCPRCNQWLPLDEFALDASRPSGRAADRLIDDNCRRYKISRGKYLALLSLQDGKCSFPGCVAPPTEIDHDHTCCAAKHGCKKCVRGLLCAKHNMALGQFSDNVERLYQAISYLDQFDLKTLRLFEILVPTQRGNGRYFTTRFHRVWDAKVREISKGLTILHPTKGQWVNPEGDLFHDRMIPVRIACTRPQILDIMELTANYYEQEAVFAHQISDTVILRYRTPKGKK